jgi:hypothetical protein
MGGGGSYDEYIDRHKLGNIRVVNLQFATFLVLVADFSPTITVFSLQPFKRIPRFFAPNNAFSSENAPFSDENAPFSPENVPFSYKNAPFSPENAPFSYKNAPFSSENALFSSENESFLCNCFALKGQYRPALKNFGETLPTF